MSYFECDHGKRHFPFGRGGRQNLLEGLKALNAGQHETAFARLSSCPLHCLPLTAELSAQPAPTASNNQFDEMFDRIGSDCIAELFKLQVEAFTVSELLALDLPRFKGILIVTSDVFPCSNRTCAV